MPEKTGLIVTCEHATNRVPQVFLHLFQDSGQILTGHQAYDPGAVTLARRLAASFHVPCLEASVSRLLVDCNRSIGHRRLFARMLSSNERDVLLNDYYLPFRHEVVTAVDSVINKAKKVLHISVHTFTPVLDGKERQADVAFLYDPQRMSEKLFCRHWRTVLKRHGAGLRIRRNYPYRGIADGFATALRKQFGQDLYLGIELEVNQRFVAGGRKNRWLALQKHIVDSLASIIENHTAVE